MRSVDTRKTDIQQRAIIARMRLKQAARWFAHQERPPAAQSTLQWIACQAWLSSPANPARAVRSALKRFAPAIALDQSTALLEHTRIHVARWSSDQCAQVLGISVWDREALKLWHLGAIDDYDYAIRNQIKAEKSALRVANFRAKNPAQRPRGRPRKSLTPTQTIKLLKHKRKMAAKRAKKYRKTSRNKSVTR